jgi:hypothetical protein
MKDLLATKGNPALERSWHIGLANPARPVIADASVLVELVRRGDVFLP